MSTLVWYGAPAVGMLFWWLCVKYLQWVCTECWWLLVALCEVLTVSVYWMLMITGGSVWSTYSECVLNVDDVAALEVGGGQWGDRHGHTVHLLLAPVHLQGLVHVQWVCLTLCLELWIPRRKQAVGESSIGYILQTDSIELMMI